LRSILAKLAGRGEDVGATQLQDFGCGEELDGEIERRDRSLRKQPTAALAGDVGKTLGDIGPPGKDDAFDPGADRRLGRPGIIAAIDQRRRLRRRYSFARRPDQRAEPAGSGGGPGIGGAEESDRAAGLGGRAQRRDGMRQRVDDDDGRCIGARLLRRSAPRNDEEIRLSLRAQRSNLHEAEAPLRHCAE
jgi:hypothetical protein